ncbi:MAG: hypothetical protein ACI7YS_08460 [Flavobacterium sp.]
MKNILYGLLAIVLYSGTVSAQTLMSDEEHRIMMNNFAIELNNTLTYNCPQGITLDQYKRGIVDGSQTLPLWAQNSLIQNYTQPLKDYGNQFAAAKGLTANTDALKYFYSSFAPSTVIQNGKLIESTTSAGLTATEMWTCALETFGTDSCGSSVLVSDKSNLSTLATTSVNKLTAVPGNIGVLVMLNGFGECLFYSGDFLISSKITDNTSLDILKSSIPAEMVNGYNFNEAAFVNVKGDNNKVIFVNSIDYDVQNSENHALAFGYNSATGEITEPIIYRTINSETNIKSLNIESIDGTLIQATIFNTYTQTVFARPDTRPPVSQCGQRVAECIADVYVGHGWTSVVAGLTSAFFPQTAVAFTIACAVKNCNSTKILPR